LARQDRIQAIRTGFGSRAAQWQISTHHRIAYALVAYDDQCNAVAAVTVWSAGRGKPGLLEPMGVHRDHRGHGYGKAITVAAAAALQDLGSSSAIVCTPSVNIGGVATYKAAGFQQLPEVRDRYRDA
jgi:ribosomal protein S18 acetylase RimI-like enzyme